MKQVNQKPVEELLSVVIPAYNEASNIGAVLAVLRAVKQVGQILVVDDGSVDETAVVIQKHQARDKRISLLRLEQNRGKGEAMFAGVAAAGAPEWLLFLDADLKGLRPFHVQRLIQPVQQGGCAMTVGLFADGRWMTNLTHYLFPFLSGQRCLRWSLFQDLYRDKINGWSIETALNLHAWHKDFAVQYVMWPGVTHATRAEKRTGLAGYWSHVKMWLEIGQYFFHFMRRTRPLLPSKQRPRPVSHSVYHHIVK